MKKIIAAICTVFVFCFALTGVTVFAKTADYRCTVSKDYRVSWSNGTNKVYLNKAGNKLYIKNIKTGKAKLLKKLKVDKDGEWFYEVANVYGNKIYLNYTSGIGESQVYVYDMKAKGLKFYRLKKSFNIQSVSGAYMVVADYLPTDITPYPSYIYKITSKGLKKVKTLGKNTSLAGIKDGKVYYAEYPESNIGQMQKMNVYTCDLNGKHKKLLFTRALDGKDDYIQPIEITEEKITFAEYNSATGEAVEYVYDCATEKITKK